MSRALLVLNCRRERERAKAWIDKAPAYTRLEFKAPRRSLEQSALMWVLLGKIATQLPWHGIKLSADDWKLLMLDALKREVRMVPNIDGNGFVSLDRSSSDLSKDEMSQLIELILAFGANHGVVFEETESPALAGIEEGQPRSSVQSTDGRSQQAGGKVAPSSPAREMEDAR